MARIYVDGISSTYGDTQTRALEFAIVRHFLAGGSGFFLRAAGMSDGGPLARTFWVSPGSALRFEYDRPQVPALELDAAEAWHKQIKNLGGLILGESEDGVDKDFETLLMAFPAEG